MVSWDKTAGFSDSSRAICRSKWRCQLSTQARRVERLCVCVWPVVEAEQVTGLYWLCCASEIGVMPHGPSCTDHASEGGGVWLLRSESKHSANDANDSTLDLMVAEIC